ncbi:MAG: hypothetical protein JXR96_28235 [Deltaproteobacteria bacterium]|nr:hypothetical protein [Deltaproteobacteria bacterium]
MDGQEHSGRLVERTLAAAASARALGSTWRRKLLGRQRYAGRAPEICEQVVRACFDSGRRFFRASPRGWSGFRVRDFGRVAPALLELGFEAEVGDSLRYALKRYERAGRFALVISPFGREVFDVRAYAPDGFALLLRALHGLRDGQLVERHRPWLERETWRFFRLVVDPSTGLVRERVPFSEARGLAGRSSSCYSNAMCYLVQQELDALRLPNPLAAYDYGQLVRKRFLIGDRFRDEMGRAPTPSGDAAIMPFWTGLMGEGARTRGLFERVLARLDADGLTRPYPARYGGSGASRRPGFFERFDPDLRDAVWTSLGLQLLETTERLLPERHELELARYVRMVERLGCFPDVLDARSGDPYSGPFYQAEDSVIWAAALWAMLRRKRRR